METWYLAEGDTQFKLALLFGNGMIGELRLEGESEQALMSIKSLFMLAGNTKLASETEIAKLQ